MDPSTPASGETKAEKTGQPWGTSTVLVVVAIVLIGFGGIWWLRNGDSGSRNVTAPPPVSAPTGDPVANAEAAAKSNPTPDVLLNLSLAYYNAGRYNDTITTAQAALKLRPAFPAAWNNIAAGYEALGLWDEAIHACEEALKIDPNFQLAQNNLRWSQTHKADAEKAKAQAGK